MRNHSPQCRTKLAFAPLIPTWFIVFTLMALVICLSGCKWPWADKVQSSSILLSGSIEARETDVAFQVPGRIATLSVDEGDIVKAGQDVASLDSRDYELALASAQANAAVSKAALKLVEAGARPQELQVAKAAVEQAEAQLRYAKSEVRRISSLVPKHLASQDQSDRARLQEDVARATLSQAQQKLALLQEGARKEEIARARADFAAKQQAVAMAQQQLSYVNLKSPVSGYVTLRLAEKGEVVGVGQAVFRVVTLDKPWVRVYISERDLPRIKLDQTAEVRVDGLPGKVFKGRVAFISPEAEFTPKTVETKELRVDQVYRVKVEVANPNGILKIGMPADVTLQPVS